MLIRDFTYIFLKGDRDGNHRDRTAAERATLLKMIAGEVEPDVGTIEIGQTVKIGYFSQESEALDDNMRVIDYIKEAGRVCADHRRERSRRPQMLERFLFDGAMQWSLIGKLSGGEKRTTVSSADPDDSAQCADPGRAYQRSRYPDPDDPGGLFGRFRRHRDHGFS